MSIWRPSSSIQVKALGLVWREGALLAAEIPEDNGDVKGIRPLGGTFKFGETWQMALLREFQEELGTDITFHGQPEVMENIYSHHGVTGHEIIFLSHISLIDRSFYSKEEITFSEDNGIECTARWFPLERITEQGLDLFPSGLLGRLRKTVSEENQRPVTRS